MMNRRVSKIPGRGPASRAGDCVALVWLPSAKSQDAAESLRKRQLRVAAQRRPGSREGSRLLWSAGGGRPGEKKRRWLSPKAGNTKTTRRRGGIVTSRRPAPRPAPRRPGPPREGGGQTRGWLQGALFLPNLLLNIIHCQRKRVLNFLFHGECDMKSGFKAKNTCSIDVFFPLPRCFFFFGWVQTHTHWEKNQPFPAGWSWNLGKPGTRGHGVPLAGAGMPCACMLLPFASSAAPAGHLGSQAGFLSR